MANLSMLLSHSTKIEEIRILRTSTTEFPLIISPKDLIKLPKTFPELKIIETNYCRNDHDPVVPGFLFLLKILIQKSPKLEFCTLPCKSEIQGGELVLDIALIRMLAKTH